MKLHYELEIEGDFEVITKHSKEFDNAFDHFSSLMYVKAAKYKVQVRSKEEVDGTDVNICGVNYD